MTKYDVIVIGAGHAGLEAAFACSRMNFKVALITLNKKSIALTPCNPSIGGPAKGIVTREIDALGGIQGEATDHTQLQMKMLNASKGAGVWALRAQIDKEAYHDFFMIKISKDQNIDLLEEEVNELIFKDNVCLGVKTLLRTIYAKKVILTTGTYMNALVHVGHESKVSGPSGLKTTSSLGNQLKNLGIKIIRLKTGTPPRVDKASINFDLMEIEPGTNAKLAFSHFNPVYLPFEKQMLCHLTYTNEKTHQIINNNLKKSAMFSGNITGVGPRYCPSIEDKIVRFSTKERHQLFIEPETANSNSMYIQGLSTSFPIDIQEQIVHSIKGLEHAKILQYAYAIEYDALDPMQLYLTLESKKYQNLYFAGQVNGTSGYEEAACQGLMAAINACLAIQNKPPLILKRNEAYIGVLIDDLVTKGVTDPYRLLTSRAEYRLLLRNDNADERLTTYGYQVGSLSKEKYQMFLMIQKQVDETIDFLKKTKLSYLKRLSDKYHSTAHNLYELLKRPEITLEELLKVEHYSSLNEQAIKKIEIKTKFEGYIKNQEKYINRLQTYEMYDLSHIKDYASITHLSLEARDKLNKVLPRTLGQAQRISGINISDLMVIKYYLDHKK